MPQQIYDIRQHKADLRKKQSALRNALNLDSKIASKNIVAIFKNNIELEQKTVIASYRPINNETPVDDLENFLRQEGHTIVLPVMNGKENPLIFREYNKDTVLVKNNIGIEEPSEDSKKLLPSVFLVPLLAFDKRLRRLGYGGGYYDRTIRNFAEHGHKTILIGIGYSVQEIDVIPCGKFDRPMDMIVTEKKLHALNL